MRAMPPPRRTLSVPRSRPEQQHINRQKNPVDQLRRFERMPAARREKEIAKLPPGQQARVRQQLDRFEKMPPDKRDKAMKRLEAFQNLPADRRPVVRQEIESLRNLPPGERRDQLNSRDLKKSFSSEEQKIIRGSIQQDQPF